MTRKWRKKAELYKRFSTECKCATCLSGLDFSEEAAQHLFIFESTGIDDGYRPTGLNLASLPIVNGYENGKALLNVSHEMWREGIDSGCFSEIEYETWCETQK